MSIDLSSVDLSNIDMTDESVFIDSIKKKVNHAEKQIRDAIRKTGNEKPTSSSVYSYHDYQNSNGFTSTITISPSGMTSDYTTWDSTEEVYSGRWINNFTTNSNDIRIYMIDQTVETYESTILDSLRLYSDASGKWYLYHLSDDDDTDNPKSILRRRSINENPRRPNDSILSYVRSNLGWIGKDEMDQIRLDTKSKDLFSKLMNELDISSHIEYESMMLYQDLLDEDARNKYLEMRGNINWTNNRYRDKKIYDEIRTSFYRRPTTDRFDRVEYEYEMDQVAKKLSELL